MSEAAIPAAPPVTKPSGRIAKRFRELSEAGELGLVAYITAGDPSLDASEKIVLAAAEAGADIIELGVPFSDPLADGPTIQRASERALRAGTTLAGVIDLVRRLRKHTEVPLVLFSYFNPILQMGIEKFADAASAAGADGVLATDLTPEESADYRKVLRSRGLDTIFLAAPTSTDARLAKIAGVSTGFLYLISRTGVTGARESLPEELPGLVRRIRKITALPDRSRIRHLAADPRHRARRNRGRSSRWLCDRCGNREGSVSAIRRQGGGRSRWQFEARGATGRQSPQSAIAKKRLKEPNRESTFIIPFSGFLAYTCLAGPGTGRSLARL